ncbi:hypothetical protein PM082_012707 [Marasmius tenuissimus]|nr:hypothetical protein PM082_012707 [Marasmius tenuissimus]
MTLYRRPDLGRPLWNLVINSVAGTHGLRLDARDYTTSSYFASTIGNGTRLTKGLYVFKYLMMYATLPAGRGKLTVKTQAIHRRTALWIDASFAYW